MPGNFICMLVDLSIFFFLVKEKVEGKALSGILVPLQHKVDMNCNITRFLKSYLGSVLLMYASFLA